MTAKEAWENLSVETVQQAVGTAASHLTTKASELTTVATSSLGIASVQQSIGSMASKLANVASKAAYEAASTVPKLIPPKQKAGFSEDGVTVTNRDMGPGMDMMVVQHAQNAEDIWEPPVNSFKMESIRENSEDVELDKSFDEIIKTKDKGTGSDRKRTTYQGRSGQTFHGKVTEMPGPLRSDDKLFHRRGALHGNSRDKHLLDDGFEPAPVYGNSNLNSNRKTHHVRPASIHHTKDTKKPTARYTSTMQDPMRGKHVEEPRTQRHLTEGSGPRFTEGENEYDALGVSSVWKSPYQDLLSADRTKAISQRWQDKKDRSAQDEENQKVPAKREARPSRIPVRAAKGPITVGDIDHKDEKNQGKTWVAGMDREAAITVSLPSLQRFVPHDQATGRK